MGVVITTANQKGGVGKTLTVSSVAAVLTQKGYKVLCVDLDPQRNLDMVAGAKKHELTIPLADTKTLSMLHVLRGDCSIEECIVPSEIGNIARASSMLSQWTGEQTVREEEYLPIRDNLVALQELLDTKTKNKNNITDIYRILRPIKDQYDYILIDTNPSLMLLTLNAIYASDYILVPAFPEETSIQALMELNSTIAGIKKSYPGRDINIIGLLLTNCSTHFTQYKRFINRYTSAAKKIGTRLFSTSIRKSIRASEYCDAGVNLLKYAPDSTAAKDYVNFADELITAIREKETQKHNTQLY